MSSFDSKYMTSYLTAIVMFTKFHTVCKIFAKHEQCQNFDLENEDKGQGVEEQNLSHSSGNVRILVDDVF